MLFEAHEEFRAQPLDEEGDPVGELVTLPAGKYRPLGGFNPDEEYGGVRIWIEPEGSEDIYEARGLRFNG